MGPSRARHRLHHPHPEVRPIEVEATVRFLSRRRIGKPAQPFDRRRPVDLIRIWRITRTLAGGPIAHQIPQMAGIGAAVPRFPRWLEEQLKLGSLSKGSLDDLEEILKSPHLFPLSEEAPPAWSRDTDGTGPQKRFSFDSSAERSTNSPDERWFSELDFFLFPLRIGPKGPL